ncbi:MAG TPA: cytochrome ubiquinol oxidase subunit I [bacterium]|jgi:cytochrome d ubiquinol oxidase subunit I
MNLDVELLSRIQFAMTVGFHFLFPPITIGLAWLLVIIEWLGWRKNSADYVRLGKFFGRILALTFAVGVATGIVMEFQFGTNWAQYSKFVGDIFGAPLAAEGVLAFFLESAFLGLYLFGRNRVSKGMHWFSSLMVAFGATLSAFWIIVANSWQQTPAGYSLNATAHRAELSDFWAAAFNPSTLPRYFHTVDAALIAGAFLVAGLSAYLILHNKEAALAQKSMRIAIIFGLVASCLEIFPFGHEHGRQVAATQPEKFAAMNGLYTSVEGAPIVLFAVPQDQPPPVLRAEIKIPGLLSWLAFGDAHAHVQGINEFPPENIPPLFLTFVSYHNMVLLGMYFVGIMVLATFLLRNGVLFEKKWLLKLFVFSIPLPLLACQLGWMAAEVGRQPWIVYHLMRTRDAFSPVLSEGQVWFSLTLLTLMYAFLGVTYVYLLKKKLAVGPVALTGKEK